MRDSYKLSNVTKKPTLTPTQTHYCNNAFELLAADDDDKTIITSNKSTNNRAEQRPPLFQHKGYKLTAMAWKSMLTAHEKNHGPMPKAMLKTGGIQITIDMAVPDAGTTSHFVLPGAQSQTYSQPKRTLL